MSIFLFTSKDAYNGCLSLFSREERAHRGYICLPKRAVVESVAEVASPERPAKLPRLAVDHEVTDAGFYMIFADISKSSSHSNKISVSADYRDLDDLLLAFPTIDPSQVNAVWETQRSYGACFDVLSSLLSHYSALQLRADTCSFVHDNWPALERSVTCAMSRLSFSSDGHSDWSLLDHHSESEHDWEIIEAIQHEQTPAKPSYKDKLLSNLSSEPSVASSKRPHRIHVPWNPKICLTYTSHRRVDHIYCDDLPTQDDDVEFMDDIEIYEGSKSFARTERSNCVLAPRRHPKANMGSAMLCVK